MSKLINNIELDGEVYEIADAAARAQIGEYAALVIDLDNISSLPQTINDNRITANHVLLHWEMSAPAAQTGDWTVHTEDGSATVSGSISGSTTLKLVLGKS